MQICIHKQMYYYWHC